jgi:hypothetical protein
MSGNEKNKSTAQMADKNWFIVMAAVIVCFAFSPPKAGADTSWGKPVVVTERQKFLASDGNTDDWFGWSVSISSDYAIVGATQNIYNGTGSAYIFKWDGTSWVEQQKLLASDGAVDSFGYSVSISGDYAIVGAYGDDDKGIDSGSVYIFKRDGTSWVEQQKLLASDGAANDNFGYSVSISGDYAIVGAIYDDDKGTNSGSAYIFKWDGTSWVEQQKLLASDGAAVDLFGSSVSISGDYAIVGAYGDDAKGIDSGSVYVFLRSGTSWSQQQKLTASDGAAGDLFGYSVSISGDYAIVGAHQDDDKGTNSGSAYIFKRDVTSWSQQAQFLASDGAAGDLFGCSVSISGDLAIVGARSDDFAKGSAYIFRWDVASWSQQQKLLASSGVVNLFGRSVSISGDSVIVGAYQDDSSKGSAYTFRFCQRADLDDDCKVDFADFAIFADWWLYGTD